MSFANALLQGLHMNENPAEHIGMAGTGNAFVALGSSLTKPGYDKSELDCESAMLKAQSRKLE